MTGLCDSGIVVPDLLSWFNPSIEIGDSKIHGKGVIARFPIAAGDVIMRMGGFLLPAASRGSPGVIKSTEIGVTEHVILAEVAGSVKDISDFINHGCSPKCGFADAVTVIAVQGIDPREEVTIDYAYWEADEEWVLRQPCTCGSSVCRVTIRGTDWRRPELAERCLLWASPFIRRRIRENSIDGRQL